jgi:hypothetical protein
MGMPKGKYTKIDSSNIKAVGRCDRSGYLCRREDLVKQMEYSGTGLYWTGLWVLKKFLDKPNPALLAPPIKADPKPIKDPRPDDGPDIYYT